MVNIDYKDRRPIYEQIANGIEDLTARNILKADEQLPSVRQLAIELSINPNTIQRAYGQLESQGIIYSVKGKGNFISSGGDKLCADKIAAIFSEMTKLAASAASLGATKDNFEKWFSEFIKTEERRVTE